MPLFEFELAPVEDVSPSDEPGQSPVSWFDLTYGTFWMPVGADTLFQYTPEVNAHWGVRSSFADYQVAAFARDMLSAAAAGLAPLPALMERLATDWNSLSALERSLRGRDDDDSYAAMRWLGERSPRTDYLVESPRIFFLRVGEQIRVHWDNEDRVTEGIPVWSATRGIFALSVEAFADECRSFRDRLLLAMSARLDAIDTGRVKLQANVDPTSLRQQHDTWRRELATYTDRAHRPDVAWEDAENALRRLSAMRDLGLG